MRWRNIDTKIEKYHDREVNLKRFRTEPKGAQTIKIGLYFLP